MLQEHPEWGGMDLAAAPTVFADLTAYLKLPLDRIVRQYWEQHDSNDAAAQLRVAQASDEATVLAYYAETPMYLYQLSFWEATYDKQGWFRVLAAACRKHGLRRVLDFGGGVGGLTLFLHAHGIRCDYLDVPGKTFDYAAWRFAQRGQAVSLFHATQIDGQPEHAYDAVIVWDVLEHLFDLEGAITDIVRLLRPGGWLISKSTFAHGHGHDEHVHLAKHACYSDVRQFDQLVAHAGFRYRGQLKPNRLSRAVQRLGLRRAVWGVRLAPRLKYGGNFLVHERACGTAGRPRHGDLRHRVEHHP